MVDIFETQKKNMVDFSIIPSLRCNLRCSFCMYDATSDKKDTIDASRLLPFLSTINWNQIHGVGFYGGEISIDLPLYQYWMDQIPLEIPKFTITNGTWSASAFRTARFIEFCVSNDLQVFISSTPEHTRYQHQFNIQKALVHSRFHIKEDDTRDNLLPMGRNTQKNQKCTQKCRNFLGPIRLAAMPNGTIIWQRCDGIYPVVGTIDEPFDLQHYQEGVLLCPNLTTNR